MYNIYLLYMIIKKKLFKYFSRNNLNFNDFYRKNKYFQGKMNTKFLGPSTFLFFYHNIILIIIEMTAIKICYIIFFSNLKKIKIFLTIQNLKSEFVRSIF